jgi:pyridoxine/pyridoxamine 5'-phosphate oxidase
LDPHDTVRRQIETLLFDQRLATLSTSSAEGHPYASLVAFDASRDLRGVVFATSRATRKFANLETNARAALLVENSRNLKSDIYEAMAVTILGAVKELAGPARAEAQARYCEKHPHLAGFVRSPSTALLRLEVMVYYLVNRFQKVMEYHVGRQTDSAAGGPAT